jgi:hypothetical protein
MSEEEFLKALGKVTVFGRVLPEHKMKIIDGFKKRGEIIGMTGDGVNDALSLRAAHLGIAMGQGGTEVAKEAADIVLLDNNFKSIVAAIEEGRRIYGTIKNVVLYLISTGLGEFLTIFGSLLLGWKLPILPSQILWLNLVTDGFLVFALGLEPKEPFDPRDPRDRSEFLDRYSQGELRGTSLDHEIVHNDPKTFIEWLNKSPMYFDAHSQTVKPLVKDTHPSYRAKWKTNQNNFSLEDAGSALLHQYLRNYITHAFRGQ